MITVLIDPKSVSALEAARSERCRGGLGRFAVLALLIISVVVGLSPKSLAGVTGVTDVTRADAPVPPQPTPRPSATSTPALGTPSPVSPASTLLSPGLEGTRAAAPDLGSAYSTSGSTPQRDVAHDVQELLQQAESLTQKARDLAAATGVAGATIKPITTRLDIFHSYMGVFVVAFVVALIATPIMRRLAIMNGVVDRPNESRKIHRIPIAYLGGVAVYLGLLAGIFFSYTQPYHGMMEFHASTHLPPPGQLPGGVPLSVLLGMTVIMLCGLMDDVMHIDPRTKIAGMLFASAALATQDVGVKVAAGLIQPVARSIGLPMTNVAGFDTLLINIPIPGFPPIDVIYWVGTAVIAIFVLGACNASNLIDGLDGLLSGTTAISAAGLLIIALTLALVDDGPRDSARIILCLAVLGACLGFLPHNFNPATIFLGDTGSLLLGYCTIVIVLMLGDTGKTHLVLAGVVIYFLPIMDTTLAIIRRKVSGKRISDADADHLHHMLKRSLGVKGAVLVLYGIAGSFAVLGVALSEGRGRVTYALVLLFAAYIGITAFKIARKTHIEKQMATAEEERARKAALGISASPQVAAPKANGPRPEGGVLVGLASASGLGTLGASGESATKSQSGQPGAKA